MRQSNRSTHRAFYALTFPRSTEAAIANVIAELCPHDNKIVRWTPERNLHVTLRFLGELPTNIFREARQVMKQTELPHTCHLHFKGINGLPSLSRPNVIVLDLEGVTEEDQTQIASLQLLTESFAQTIGLKQEERAFRPHVTLGRVRRDQQISESLRSAIKNLHIVIPEVEIRDLVLIESFLSREGAEYRIAEKCSLSW
ncbi:MAG: RNA 2',3'-cyclic phosphodiesterase [Ignavibacteriae bacterium]|nr:RNA 2',3'-cyclic phosphodiesterase [Ignavibacteriota bacterium]MCB9215093.1 RNA 2',3'-cyclic phosphodiesterase [Ignavibacteria bacterium]